MQYSEKVYKEFVLQQECLLDRRCSGDVVAHHLRSSKNAGVGMKPPDIFCVPLCHLHHSEIHLFGGLTFQNKYGVNLWEVLEEMHERFESKYKLQLNVLSAKNT